MALPILNTTIHELSLPSTGEKIKFRPFLVKEEKILLTALEGGEEKEITNATKQIISQCISSEDFDINNVPTFDVEYIFLMLRSKSVGEQIELKYEPECYEKCKTYAEIKVDIKEVKVEKTKDHTNRIKLTKDVILDLKYPKIDTLTRLNQSNQIDMVFDVVLNCIDKIYEGKEVHNSVDYKKEELMEFLNSLSSKQFQKIQEFFDTMPKLRYKSQWSCPNCGKEDEKIIEGLNSFFELA